MLLLAASLTQKWKQTATFTLRLKMLTGNNVGTVSAEIPVGPKWCEIRQTVFGWTTQKFPFGVKTAHALKIREPHVITVTCKAFYDIGHAPAWFSSTEIYLDPLLGPQPTGGTWYSSDILGIKAAANVGAF